MGTRTSLAVGGFVLAVMIFVLLQTTGRLSSPGDRQAEADNPAEVLVPDQNNDRELHEQAGGSPAPESDMSFRVQAISRDNGEPALGALVWITPPIGEFSKVPDYWIPPEECVIVDEFGFGEMRFAESAGLVVVEYFGQLQMTQISRSVVGTTVVVELSSPASLSGRVRDSAGALMEGATVSLVDPGRIPLLPLQPYTETDSFGGFAFEGVRPGDVAVVVSGQGADSWLSAAKALLPGHAAFIDVNLPGYPHRTVLVVGKDGLPVAGVPVVASWAGRPAVGPRLTSSLGRASFFVPAGEIVSAMVRVNDLTVGREFQVARGWDTSESEEIVLNEIKKGLSISGVVTVGGKVGSKGRVIARQGMQAQSVAEVAESDGYFQFESMYLGEAIEVSFSGNGREFVTTYTITPEEGESEVHVELDFPAGATGVEARDAHTGAGITGCPFALVSLDDKSSTNRIEGFLGHDGRTLVEGLPPGDYQLLVGSMVSGAGESDYETKVTQVSVDNNSIGPRIQWSVVELEKLPQVELLISDSRGQALLDAQVHVLGAGEILLNGMEFGAGSPDGQILLRGLPSEAVDVVVSHSGFSPAIVKIPGQAKRVPGLAIPVELELGVEVELQFPVEVGGEYPVRIRRLGVDGSVSSDLFFSKSGSISGRRKIEYFGAHCVCRLAAGHYIAEWFDVTSASWLSSEFSVSDVSDREKLLIGHQGE